MIEALRTVLFDDQAGNYDRRAGLPRLVPERIAESLLESSAQGRGSSWIEIGPGTGEIGIQLAKRAARYAGLDRSFPMLAALRRRGIARAVQADGNAPWPFPSGSVDFVFGFRSLHHLLPAHLAYEAERVTRGERAILIAGTIRRDEAGVKEQMRRYMRQILKEKGFHGREGGRGKADWKWELEARGWQSAGPKDVASWEAECSPRQCLHSWSGKAGLAGLEVAEDTKAEVLRVLEEWAVARFGDLDGVRAEREAATLETWIKAR